MDELDCLVRQPQYYCLKADPRYGRERAQELDHDPFKVAEALSQLSDNRELAESVRRAQCGGLRAWLIAEFMRRRQLQTISERQQVTAYQNVFGVRLRWSFGGACSTPFDHTFYFRFRDRAKGYSLATHPYMPDREKWADFGSRHGAHIEFTEDFPSWWAPMLGVDRGRRWPSVLIVCTKQ
jgi:hypothetical protein